MKYLLVLLFPISCFCQTKGDSKIIATPSDTANLFNRVVSYLYEQGYSFERKDESAGFLLTDEREMKKYTAMYRLRILVKDGKATFSGSLKIPPERTFTDIFYTRNNSWNRITWDLVEEVGRHFGPVSYAK